MTSGEELDAPRKSLRYLLGGYCLVVLGILLFALNFAASFSPGGPGPIANGVALLFNFLGFLVVVHS